MTYIIREHSLGTAHEQAIKKVLQQGIPQKTEDNEWTVELNEPLNVHVGTPENNYNISRWNPFGPHAMSKYCKDLLYGGNNEFVYTYNERLFKYTIIGNHTCDQINNIIKKLQQDDRTRRAQAITCYPDQDYDTNHPPCLQRIQFLIRNNRLNMHLDMRSNDIVSGMGPNMVAFHGLQRWIADKLSIKTGWYSHQVTSAHAYHIRDIKDIEQYVNNMNFRPSEAVITELKRAGYKVPV